MARFDGVDSSQIAASGVTHGAVLYGEGQHVYDPNTNAWADEAVGVPKKLGHNRQAKSGFYDPQLNAVFLHSAGDSRDDGTIWVFRYRRARR